MENNRWDLSTVDEQNYFDLVELYSAKQRQQEMVPLADALKSGELFRK